MKAQMEVIGLVVIVVLFIFGGLIYLFFVSRPPDTSLAEVRQSSEVSNLLNSLMKLTPCEDTSDSLSNIIQTCYLFNGNRDYCQNPDCKDYIENVVINSLKAYNPSLQYTFEVKDPSQFISYGTCSFPKKMVADSSMRTGSTILKVVLTVCQK